MLCYRYAQSASEIVHDTFAWLTNNRRAAVLIALPILGVCIVCMQYITVDIDKMLNMDSTIDTLVHQLMPFSSNITDSTADSRNVAMSVAAMAALTTLLTVPLLRRYFVDRRSLWRLSAKGALSELYRHLWPAVAAALLTGLAYWVMESVANFWLNLLVITTCTLLLPCLIMKQWSGIMIQPNLWLIVKSLLFIAIVVCVVKALPWVIMSLLCVSMDLLSDIIPGIFESEGFWIDILSPVFSIIVCVSLCLSVIVYVVSSLMLHGCLFNPEEMQ